MTAHLVRGEVVADDHAALHHEAHVPLEIRDIRIENGEIVVEYR
jgi:hypothetical protein